MNSQSNSANFKSLTTRQLHVWQAQQLDLANPVYNIAWRGTIYRRAHSRGTRASLGVAICKAPSFIESY